MTPEEYAQFHQMLWRGFDPSGRPKQPDPPATIEERIFWMSYVEYPATEAQDVCRFLTCQSVLTSIFRHVNFFGLEPRICSEHTRLLKAAERAGYPIMLSVEGIVWVDNLMAIVFES